jgi:hypothetical protein
MGAQIWRSGVHFAVVSGCSVMTRRCRRIPEQLIWKIKEHRSFLFVIGLIYLVVLNWDRPCALVVRFPGC